MSFAHVRMWHFSNVRLLLEFRDSVAGLAGVGNCGSKPGIWGRLVNIWRKVQYNWSVYEKRDRGNCDADRICSGLDGRPEPQFTAGLNIEAYEAPERPQHEAHAGNPKGDAARNEAHCFKRQFARLGGRSGSFLFGRRPLLLPVVGRLTAKCRHGSRIECGAAELPKLRIKERDCVLV